MEKSLCVCFGSSGLQCGCSSSSRTGGHPHYWSTTLTYFVLLLKKKKKIFSLSKKNTQVKYSLSCAELMFKLLVLIKHFSSYDLCWCPSKAGRYLICSYRANVLFLAWAKSVITFTAEEVVLFPLKSAHHFKLGVNRYHEEIESLRMTASRELLKVQFPAANLVNYWLEKKKNLWCFKAVTFGMPWKPLCLNYEFSVFWFSQVYSISVTVWNTEGENKGPSWRRSTRNVLILQSTESVLLFSRLVLKGCNPNMNTRWHNCLFSCAAPPKRKRERRRSCLGRKDWQPGPGCW